MSNTTTHFVAKHLLWISMNVVQAGTLGWMPWTYCTYPNLISSPPKYWATKKNSKGWGYCKKNYISVLFSRCLYTAWLNINIHCAYLFHSMQQTNKLTIWMHLKMFSVEIHAPKKRVFKSRFEIGLFNRTFQILARFSQKFLYTSGKYSYDLNTRHPYDGNITILDYNVF